MKVDFDYGCNVCTEAARKRPDNPKEFQAEAGGILVAVKDVEVELIQGHESGIWLTVKQWNEIKRAVNKGLKFTKEQN